jgi:hypothetical protein
MFVVFSRNGSMLSVYTGLTESSTGKQKHWKTSDDNVEPDLEAKTP